MKDIPRPEDIDELAELLYWRAAMKAKTSRLEALQKQIRACYADADPDKTYCAQGVANNIFVGPRENQRSVNVLKALKLWTVKRLRPLLTLTITALEGEVGKQEAAKAITSARTGSRELIAVPREAEEKQAA